MPSKALSMPTPSPNNGTLYSSVNLMEPDHWPPPQGYATHFPPFIPSLPTPTFTSTMENRGSSQFCNSMPYAAVEERSLIDVPASLYPSIRHPDMPSVPGDRVTTMPSYLPPLCGAPSGPAGMSPSHATSGHGMMPHPPTSSAWHKETPSRSSSMTQYEGSSSASQLRYSTRPSPEFQPSLPLPTPNDTSMAPYFVRNKLHGEEDALHVRAPIINSIGGMPRSSVHNTDQLIDTVTHNSGIPNEMVRGHSPSSFIPDNTMIHNDTHKSHIEESLWAQPNGCVQHQLPINFAEATPNCTMSMKRPADDVLADDLALQTSCNWRGSSCHLTHQQFSHKSGDSFLVPPLQTTAPVVDQARMSASRPLTHPPSLPGGVRRLVQRMRPGRNTVDRNREPEIPPGTFSDLWVARATQNTQAAADNPPDDNSNQENQASPDLKDRDSELPIGGDDMVTIALDASFVTPHITNQSSCPPPLHYRSRPDIHEPPPSYDAEHKAGPPTESSRVDDKRSS
ncbi:hypothetical protein M231_07356 [Tremella mesenterica]|uniref:Uncharacterized protein n=2 Tax=Tremella mesenterica TaxID=5217 RepID=A0A4Q1BEA9_TREME|nr:hypothetical protein M231_07356 [Tremella mesenterica]